MTEDGIREILQARRLGHEVPGMRGVYTHVSDAMRQELKDALQTRWTTSLRARANLAARSPVRLLDDLLAPFRAGSALRAEPRHDHDAGEREKLISHFPPISPKDLTPRSGVRSFSGAYDQVRDLDHGVGHRQNPAELRVWLNFGVLFPG
jgi:hypothetical protein